MGIFCSAGATMAAKEPSRPYPKWRFTSFIESNSFFVGFSIRLSLMFALPILMDDGLLLRGVRYTDIDYDVFTDAATHIAQGRSPYSRHTYRYTPFLASLLAWPSRMIFCGDEGTSASNFLALFSTKYFGKILFCVADSVCGYIILVLRRKKRQSSPRSRSSSLDQTRWIKLPQISPELQDALWWLYNPLPINICTRGSAESLVVLLPVLATVAVAGMYENRPSSLSSWPGTSGVTPVLICACLAGILHGIGIHAKLYPIIYTVSFMANFSRQQQQRAMLTQKASIQNMGFKSKLMKDLGWTHLLSEQMQFLEDCFCCGSSSSRNKSGFPWRHPLKLFILFALWIQRIFLTMSSMLFLVVSMSTFGLLTYLAVYFYGRESLDEGLLYHFQRIDHRHNYSMYWYWIYLSRGKLSAAASRLAPLAGSKVASSAAASVAANSLSIWGQIPLIPQAALLGFTSLGIAAYDLPLALFAQTFIFVTFNKVITAQYFTWYLCLLPLCSDRVEWNSRRMLLSLIMVFVSIIMWLGSAFSLEMLGWKTHRQVWVSSLSVFLANVNMLSAILQGYRKNQLAEALSQPGVGWAIKPKAS